VLRIVPWMWMSMFEVEMKDLNFGKCGFDT
jgi:hypothetical protein